MLADTSAWVHFLRDDAHPVSDALEAALRDGAALETTDVVVMEILAGARDGSHEHRLRRLLGRCRPLPVGAADFEDAAALYRRCRRAGTTIRALTDCLIAAVAISADVAVLHDDRDFDALARHTPLRAVRGAVSPPG